MKSEKPTLIEAGTSLRPLSLVQQLAQEDLSSRSASLYQLFKGDWSCEEKALIATALLELLGRQPGLPDRAAFVLLLAELARDWSALDRAETPPDRQRRLRAILVRGLPLYLALLETSEPQLRL